MQNLRDVWVYLSANPLLHLTLTLVAFQIGAFLYQRGKLNPLLNPVLISVILLVAILTLTDTPYSSYFEGAQFVHFLLGPATVALAIPLFRIAPAVYAWRKRSRIYRWYGELKFLEADIHENFAADRLDAYLEDLERIEEQANRRRVPLAFSNELYTLREHIQLVRRELLQRAARSGKA